MTHRHDEAPAALELRLARLLWNGTWIASLVVAVGLAVSAVGPSIAWGLTGPRVVTAGLALFIFLPVARVLLMLVAFAGQRDYRFVGIAAFVLVVVLAGFALG